ncbi:MAG: methionine--tRNA ligase subunit beta, partial [Acidobacteriota bacterium]|nr:methionine--tRNA ligase subunit beta [Acidobacteriota bacterium]
IQQYRGGVIPAGSDAAIAATARETIQTATACFENFEFSLGLEAIWRLLSAVEKFIVEQAPWKLARAADAESQAKLDATLYTSAETLRIATALLSPILPESVAKIWRQLGMETPLDAIRMDSLEWGQLPTGQKIGVIEGVFPRIDLKDAVGKMRALEAEVTAHQQALLGKPPAVNQKSASETIAIEDFAKVDLRVGQVLSAEPVKGADKLLHLKIDIAEAEPRTIVAGIAEAYKPEELVGRKVVIVANLQPRKLRGIQSNGMIVAASLEGGKPVLAAFLEDVPVGARLK